MNAVPRRQMTRRTERCLSAAILFLSIVPRANAQPALQSPNAGGPMRVEQVHDGWAVAPEFKVTRFDNGTRTLAGGYVGRVIDNSLLLGFGGYGLLDGNHNRKLGYGGFLVEWREGVDRPIGFTVRGLLGVGTATASTTVVTFFEFPRANAPCLPPGCGAIGTPVNAVYRNVNFYVAEPEADLLLNVGSHVRVHAGAGYRLAGDADPIDHQIHGAVGSLSVEIGPHH
jgi:hypothetical protein